MEKGDVVYFCKTAPCIKVTYIGTSDLGCIVKMDENQFIVDFTHLQNSCTQTADNELENSETKTKFVIDQRVLLKIKDDATGSNRAWPAAIKAIHANGRLSLALDGLGGRVNANQEDILPIDTIMSNTSGS